MKNLLCILFGMLVLTSNGQDIKKGYKSLEKLDYEKAADAFENTLEDDIDNLGANLGLALIYADDKSPLFNIVKSWQYIDRIRGKNIELSQDDIDVLTEYFLNTEVRKTSRPVKKKIEIAMDAIEARYIKYIREENNLDVVYQTLEKYPNFPHYDNVVHIRNQFEFRKYEKMNTLEGYEEFIKKFPDAAQIDKAKRYRNQLAFNKAKSQNTVAAYTTYMAQYPESEYVQAAIKLRNAAAFADAKRINTLESLENFCMNYPDALEVAEAKTIQQNILYEKAKRVRSLQAYNEFIKKYPEGQFFVDIFNLKSIELGSQFIKDQNFTYPDIVWSRGFDNNGRIEFGGSIVESPQGEIFIACNTRENDTSFADAWVLKLDASGKMLWNKTIGQAFEDSVSHILLDSKGNLIVFGYTCLSADSASKMGWMFKLGNDGKKLWNRELGKINMDAFAIDENDKIYIGGSIETDSLGPQYALTIFNSDARKIGERTYTGRGSIDDLLITPDDDLFICGSGWLTLIDQRRYILWDAVVPPDLTATQSALASSGDFYVAGANIKSIFYSRYSSTGNKVWLQNFDKPDTSLIILDIAAVTNDNLLVLETKNGSSKIKLFSKEGNLLGNKEFFDPAIPQAAVAKNAGITLLISDDDLILIRFSQLASL
jgi:hypothetical protein